ncbi:MAG: peptidyl-prolyl cis-trans isomerase [Balneolaceae bacterium]|nr:peptidyl-prolyl cis-trans isomerase [Balneolaceae bacterium]MBO6546194.1 peptidyl-prolyl cis-trans isomerase [Balneolaceae bacterium]MBO6648553.1 peptidyl-prolyl cis-trans isomerase [Balneolaceae bacterium]
MRNHFIPLFIVLLLVSCTRKSQNTEPALARVGSAVLTVSEARNAIPRHIFNEDSVKAYTNYRDDWIEQQIILQDAYRLRIHRQQEVQNRLDKIQDDFLAKAAQEYILGELEMEIQVTDEEARAYYQENKASFVLEERYIRYRHLIASSLSDAQNARQDLLRGIDWITVANEYSTNPEVALRESDRFWPESIAANDVNILNRYLQVIGLSEITVIERVGTRYHFVQLMEERAKGDHPDLEWLIDQIKEWLILEKRRRAFNTYVKNLYLQAQANNEIETFNVLQEN